MTIKEIGTVVQVAFAAVGGFLVQLIGGLDYLFIALITFIAADYISGLLRAAIEKNLCSKIGFKGGVKKIFILILVAVATSIDRVVGYGEVVRAATLLFFIANEGLSILENACAVGLPVPPKLKSVLRQLKTKNNKEDEKE